MFLMCDASVDLNKSSALFDRFELREEKEAASFSGHAAKFSGLFLGPRLIPLPSFVETHSAFFFFWCNPADRQTNKLRRQHNLLG